MNAQLLVYPNGTVFGLHTEAIDLATLGVLAVQRASLVEFDEASQRWRVHDSNLLCIYSSPSRAACLSWEHHHFGTFED